jgi:leader peptidase (prepilin peptidase) / N-methyltransferase
MTEHVRAGEDGSGAGAEGLGSGPAETDDLSAASEATGPPAGSEATGLPAASEATGLPAGTFAPVPVAAAGGAGVLAAVGLVGQPWPVVVAGAGLAALGVLLTFIDVRTHRLPDKLVGPGAVWLLVMLTLAALVEGDLAALGRVVLAGAVSALGYLVLGLVRAGGLGLGDVKLAGVLGLWLGWFGWSAVLAGPVLAFVLGGLFACVLLLVGRAGRKSAFAFGPWMIVGAAVATAGALTEALTGTLLR